MPVPLRRAPPSRDDSSAMPPFCVVNRARAPSTKHRVVHTDPLAGNPARVEAVPAEGPPGYPGCAVWPRPRSRSREGHRVRVRRTRPRRRGALAASRRADRRRRDRPAPWRTSWRPPRPSRSSSTTYRLAVVAARVRQGCAPRAGDRRLPAVARLRGGPARVPGQPAPGRSASSTSWSSWAPTTMLVCSSVSPGRRRRRRPRRRAAARPGRAGGGARLARSPTRRWPGALRQHLRAPGGSCARRPPRARPVPGQLPRAVPRRRPRRDPGDPRREGVPPAARRRAAAEHGRRRVEPPPPALPRPGLVRPGRLRRPRADHRLRRAAVARGVQRRLPPGRSPARRHRRDALAARPAGGVQRRRPAAGARAPRRSGPAARPHRWAALCSPSSPSTRSPARSSSGADRARLRPHRAAPVQAGAAVAAGQRPDPAELRSTKDGPARHRGDLRAGRGELRPGRSAQRAAALLAPVCRGPGSPTRPT